MADTWFWWAGGFLLVCYFLFFRRRKDPNVFPVKYKVVVNHMPYVQRGGMLRAVMFAPEQGTSVIIVGRTQGLEELLSSGEAKSHVGTSILTPIAALNLVKVDQGFQIRPAENSLGIENTPAMVQHFLEHTCRRVNFQSLF